MDYIKYSSTLAKNKQIIDLLNREIELLKKQKVQKLLNLCEL